MVSGPLTGTMATQCKVSVLCVQSERCTVDKHYQTPQIHYMLDSELISGPAHSETLHCYQFFSKSAYSYVIEVLLKMIIYEIGVMGWRDVSVLKSIEGSSRTPEINSQQSHAGSCL